MPPTVTAIVVAGDGADYLRPTLDALCVQTRPPDRLTVVQLGDSPVTTGIVAAIEPSDHLHVAPRSGFGAAVAAGLRAERASGPSDGDAWIWLLAADNAPDPDALERLLNAVEVAPSVAVAGPKQMQWDAPDYLHSFGESMTPLGTSVELVEPELDQAQYDRLSDVLGVAAGGMLARASVWRDLGGFDPGLPAVDDALDFCVRARLAGHRVQLVPTARVRSAGIDAPGTRLLGVSTSPARRTRLQRQAHLHRRLVYAPPPLAILLWLAMLPMSVARAAGQLLRKQPEAAPAELAAALVAFFVGPPAAIRARATLRRSRTVGWSAVAPLRLPWRDVRHRRALIRENARGPRTRVPLHFVSGGGLATVAAATAVALVVCWPLLGAPALAGGGALPLGGLRELWGAVGWGWHPTGAGFTGPADPFIAVLAVLGTLTFWHPSAAIVTLFVAAIPIAALGGWLAAAQMSRRRALRIVGAILWAAAPTLLVALDAGRVAPVIAHLTMPFALLAALRARKSWTAAAVLALLTAVMTACSPSLLPVFAYAWALALVGSIVLGRSGGAGSVLRIAALPLPTVVLFGPLLAVQLRRGNPLAVLADPGVVQTVTTAHGLLGLPDAVTTALQFAIDWPQADLGAWQTLAGPLGVGAGLSFAVVVLLTAPVLVLAGIGLFWARRKAPARAIVVGVGGLAVAFLAGHMSFTAIGPTSVTVWPGAGLSLFWLGVLEAALEGLDRMAATAPVPGASRMRSRTTAFLGLVIAATVPVAVAPVLAGSLLGTAAVTASSGSTVPALVAAEAQVSPALGLLTLTPEQNGVRARLTRGSGATLEQTSTLDATSGAGQSDRLSLLAADLATPTSDDVRASLDALQVGAVLLERGAAGSGAWQQSAEGALGSDPLFSAVSTTASGTLYRYVDAAAAPTVADRGPANTATPLGLAVLVIQGGVLLVFLLLALPTRGIATRIRPRPLRAAPTADVQRTRAMALAAHQGSAQYLSPSPLPPHLPAAAFDEYEQDEEPAWR